MACSVDDILTTAFDDLGPLRRPVMLVALRGWFDAAQAAAESLRVVVGHHRSTIVASIDPDQFFDFTQERPLIIFGDDEVEVNWPANDFEVIRPSVGVHDIVVLNGVEPHLRMATFADAVVTVAETLGCEAVITVGALADATPHSRRPTVTGSTTNDELASALGLTRPSYEGITGVAGVLQARLDRSGIPAISLRVGVPHYLNGTRHPASSAALVEQLARVLGLAPDTAELHAEVEQRRRMHDEIVADDPKLKLYVGHLERRYDRQLEATVPRADDLAAQFEQFLREHTSPEDPDDPENPEDPEDPNLGR